MTRREPLVLSFLLLLASAASAGDRLELHVGGTGFPVRLAWARPAGTEEFVVEAPAVIKVLPGTGCLVWARPAASPAWQATTLAGPAAEVEVPPATPGGTVAGAVVTTDLRAFVPRVTAKLRAPAVPAPCVAGLQALGVLEAQTDW